MNSKWIEPKFITGIITMLAISLNNRFGWHLDPVELAASIAVAVNFIVAQITVEMKNGKLPTWNSTKFVTMFIACGLIGFGQYIGIELDTESVLWIAGVASSVINLKWIQDYRKEAKQSGLEQHYSDHGPAI